MKYDAIIAGASFAGLSIASMPPDKFIKWAKLLQNKALLRFIEQIYMNI